MSRVIALIPARSGSKSIPEKNFRPLPDGSTCVQRAIECAHALRLDTILSSDARFMLVTSIPVTLIQRPAELAQDDTPMLAVVQHALDAVPGEPDDIWLLLQPTQPLRQPKHLRAALDLLQFSGADSVVSVVEVPLSHSPDVTCVITGRLYPYPVYRCHEQVMDFNEQPTRRQNAQQTYRRDGTVYVFRRRTVDDLRSIYGTHVAPLIIPADESCELDTMADWAALERRLASPTRD